MERCGKINAVNSGSESWTGIGVVAGCAVVMLITQGPHVQDIATYWRIKLLHILQEVGSICKTRNHLFSRVAHRRRLMVTRIWGTGVGTAGAPKRENHIKGQARLGCKRNILR